MQASLQGCIVDTPHTQDIRDICGLTQCVDAGTNKTGATTGTSATIVLEYGAATVITTGNRGYVVKVNGNKVSVLGAVSANTTQVIVTVDATMLSGDIIEISYDSNESDLTIAGEDAASYYQHAVSNTL